MHYATTTSQAHSAAFRHLPQPPQRSSLYLLVFTHVHATTGRPLFCAMSERPCKHPDIREFDGLSCCLACGETVLDDSVLVPTNQIVDTEDHYRYASLNYNRGLEIRLIELLPGETADPIRCEIIHVNLEDTPDYDAVSYTWATESGDDSLCKTIQVLSGGSMLITANCDVALRQLRRRGLRRRLWIDAICK